jgi:hypothetical protein
MESIPSSYRSVYSFRVDPNYDENIYKKVCEGISAINILTVYRGMCFHLDAHSGNWLFNPFEKLIEQVKEIDFGRVYRIDTDTNMRKFLIDLKENMKEYFESLYESNQYNAVRLLHLFFYTMGRVEAEIREYVNEKNLEKKITYAWTLLDKEVRRMIDDFRENEYFSKPYMSLSREESAMNIKMIHRIILLYIYVDFFYNTQYRLRQGQIAHIYNIIFKTNILNIETISNLNLRLDLDEHNTLNPSNATLILQIYKRIYTIIYKFNEDRNFGNIRN